MEKSENKKIIFGSNLMQETADSILPVFVVKDSSKEILSCAKKIARAFERDKDFSDLMEDSGVSVEQKLIESFVKNIGLLLEKTWVEKSDERLKDETLNKLEVICNAFLNRNGKDVYKYNFFEFFSMLKDIVFLMFGETVHSHDFTEYALRMDTNFGFFWHYITVISKMEIFSEEKARISIMLAVIFLANF